MEIGYDLMPPNANTHITKLPLYNGSLLTPEEQEECREEGREEGRKEGIKKGRKKIELVAFNNLMTPILKKYDSKHFYSDLKESKKIFKKIFPNWDDEKIQSELKKLSKSLGINIKETELQS